MRSRGLDYSPRDLPAEDWDKVLGQLQGRFPEVSPKKVSDALKSCNGHAGRAAATLRALSSGGESAGSHLGNRGLRTMRLGSTTPTDSRLADAAPSRPRSSGERPPRDNSITSKYLDAVRASRDRADETHNGEKRNSKSVPRDSATLQGRGATAALSAAEQLTSLLSGAMTSWPNRPEQRSLLPAQIWVARYQTSSSPATMLSYPNKVQVDVGANASSMVSAARANQGRISYISEILESAGHVHTGLILFRQYDDESNGYLVWDGGKLRDFVLSVFQHYALVPPSDDQIRGACQFFGDLENKEEPAFLEARECLCAVDVLFQTLRAAASLPAQEEDSSLHLSPASRTSQRFELVESHGVVEVCIKSASRLKNADNGLFGKVTDPFAVARIGMEERATETAYNTLSPVWKTPSFHFNIDFTQLAARVLQLEVLDHNSTHRSKTFGKAEVDLVGLAPDETLTLRKPLQGGGGGELEFELTYRTVVLSDGASGHSDQNASHSVGSSAGSHKKSPSRFDDVFGTPLDESIVRRLDQSLGAAAEPQQSFEKAAVHLRTPFESSGAGISASQFGSNDGLSSGASAPTSPVQLTQQSTVHTPASSATKKSERSHIMPDLQKDDTADLGSRQTSPTVSSLDGKAKLKETDEMLEGLVTRIEMGIEADSQVMSSTLDDLRQREGSNCVEQKEVDAELNDAEVPMLDEEELPGVSDLSIVDDFSEQHSLKDTSIAASLSSSKPVSPHGDTQTILTQNVASTALVSSEHRSLGAESKGSPNDQLALEISRGVPKPSDMAELVATVDAAATLLAEKERRGLRQVYQDRQILAWQLFSATFRCLRASSKLLPQIHIARTDAVFSVAESQDYEQTHAEGDGEYMAGDEFIMCMEEADVEIQLRVRGLKAGAMVQIMYEHVSVNTGSRHYKEHVVSELRVEKLRTTPPSVSRELLTRDEARLPLQEVNEIKEGSSQNATVVRSAADTPSDSATDTPRLPHGMDPPSGTQSRSDISAATSASLPMIPQLNDVTVHDAAAERFKQDGDAPSSSASALTSPRVREADNRTSASALTSPRVREADNRTSASPLTSPRAREADNRTSDSALTSPRAREADNRRKDDESQQVFETFRQEVAAYDQATLPVFEVSAPVATPDSEKVWHEFQGKKAAPSFEFSALTADTENSLHEFQVKSTVPQLLEFPTPYMKTYTENALHEFKSTEAVLPVFDFSAPAALAEPEKSLNDLQIKKSALPIFEFSAPATMVDTEKALHEFQGKQVHHMRKAELVSALAQMNGTPRAALERCSLQRLRMLLREALHQGKTLPRQAEARIETSKSWEPPAIQPLFAEDRLSVLGPSWTHGDLELPLGQVDMGGWYKRVYTEEQQGRLKVTECGSPLRREATGHPIHLMRKVELVNALVRESDYPRAALEKSSVMRLRLLLRSVRGEEPMPRGEDADCQALEQAGKDGHGSGLEIEVLDIAKYAEVQAQTSELQQRLASLEKYGKPGGSKASDSPVVKKREIVKHVSTLHDKITELEKAAEDRDNLEMKRKRSIDEHVSTHVSTLHGRLAALERASEDHANMQMNRKKQVEEHVSTHVNTLHDKLATLEKAAEAHANLETFRKRAVEDHVSTHVSNLHDKLNALEKTAEEHTKLEIDRKRAMEEHMNTHVSSLHGRLAGLEKAAEERANLETSRKKAMEEHVSQLHTKLSTVEKIHQNRAEMEASFDQLVSRISMLENAHSEGHIREHKADAINFKGSTLPIFSEIQLHDMPPSRVLEHAQHLHEAVGHDTVRSALPDDQQDHGGIIRWLRRFYWNHLASHVEKSGKAKAHFLKDCLKVTVQRAKDLDGPAFSKDGTIYCICQIPGVPKSWCQTNAVQSAHEIVWNQELDIREYVEGHHLEFTIMQSCSSSSSKEFLLGRVLLESAKFYPDGFEGDLSVNDIKIGCQGSLEVAVKVDDSSHNSQALVVREKNLRRQLHQYQEQVADLEQTFAENNEKHETALREMRRKHREEEAQIEVRLQHFQEISAAKQLLEEKYQESQAQVLAEREKTQEAVCEVRRLTEILGQSGIKMKSRNDASTQILGQSGIKMKSRNANR